MQPFRRLSNTFAAVCFVSLTTFAIFSPSIAADPISDNEALFARRITNLLTEKCIACHGADENDIQGGLDLRTAFGASVGGDSGHPALIAGNAKQSPLYLAAKRQSNDWSAMPPKEAESLTEQQLDWLADWINGGANWPTEARIAEITESNNDQWSAEDGVTVSTSGGLSDNWTNRRYDPAGLWAYQPVVRPKLVEPQPGKIETQASAKLTSQASVQPNPIDQLLAYHRPQGLTTAPVATRNQLIRRATFDLIGLPPTVAQVQAFVDDPRDDETAFADVIERLLASPHYGERMAQHWLDVVRYADSSGFANDYERGNAWRYRDYVIRSFNSDKPYNQFVIEQIAGDEIQPNNPESIVATGMLRMGPWELTGMEVAKVARQRFLDDVTNNVGETFLAHSLQCARCHDHKFDPIPTQDYYGFQAVFATTQLAERPAPFLPSENIANFDEQEYLKRRQQDHQETLDQLNEILLNNAIRWYEENGIDPTPWHDAIATLEKNGQREVTFNAVRNRVKQAGVPEDQYPPKLVGFTPEQFGLERVARKGLERLRWQLERYQPYALAVYSGRTPQMKSVYAPLRIPASATSEGELEQTCILSGGDPFSPTTPVQPSTLSALHEQIDIDIPTEIEGRRAELARWIASPKNPLTTRSIVNRIWLWHFGTAIAGNPNNFGSTGKRPTHPELLDWLAAEFVDQGWSFKQLHRTIMLSHAYRQSSTHPEPAAVQRLDPLSESYSVFQRRRLSAEEIRDAMLAASGELNPAIGGIPCRPEINQEVALQPRQVMGTFAAAWTPNPKPQDRHRRSIYVLRLRGLTVPMFDVFNAPGPDFSCEQRSSSTVTPQVFSLLNSENSHSRALSLAISLLSEPVSTEAERADVIDRAFERLFSRPPSSEEQSWCIKHWQETESDLDEPTVEKSRQLHRPPTTILRTAVEENTGERFSFEEKLYPNLDYIPDHDPSKITRQTLSLADVCLALLNSNEFVYLD